MNIKTFLPNCYVNFVDRTEKENKYFKIILLLIVIVIGLFLIFVLFNYSKD